MEFSREFSKPRCCCGGDVVAVNPVNLLATMLWRRCWCGIMELRQQGDGVVVAVKSVRLTRLTRHGNVLLLWYNSDSKRGDASLPPTG